MANERFWDIPPLRVFLTAFGVIFVFLGLAYCLYQNYQGPPPNAYALKVADAFINGAIVGILFAILRAMFDLPKLLGRSKS
jgi:hypothetical protein